MSTLNKKVSVFVGGAQKSGTRSISQYFRQHPNLSVHKTKEGHFFDRPENFNNGAPISSLLNKYLNSFSISSETQLLCDITPDYIFREGSVERIFNYNPSAIWIILLRNPAERAYSSWNMEVNRNTENLSFEDALENEINGTHQSRLEDRFMYMGRSRYYQQILKLWKYFPKSQCHIYPAELVWEQPKENLNHILRSINATVDNGYSYYHVHKGTYKHSLSEYSREILKKELYFELNELPALLGWDKNPWV